LQTIPPPGLLIRKRRACSNNMSNAELLKKTAGYKAASFVQDHTTIGLGTGSTVYYFIEKLIERKQQEKLNIQVVATSLRSLEQAEKGGLHIADINQITSIDLTVDGADEIDAQKRMIKGGGGALLREKIIASTSKELVIIIDETKKVPLLGHKKLPVEVVPFACKATLHKIQKTGLRAEFRMEDLHPQKLYQTDNGNYIIDIYFNRFLDNPEKYHMMLKEIPGVIETGFFFHLAGRVIISYFDGQTLVI
jgi:ribose 5-phosphate isomerase A